jgi:hypothetical protein
MMRRLLAIGALFGVLAVACGKVGPPVRLRAEPTVRVDANPTAAGSSETTERAGATAAEKSEDEERKP